MSIEERLRAFIDKGYRPQIKSHLVPGEPREGWATLHWREWIRGLGEDDVQWLSEPHADSVGWEVDAFSVLPDRPAIHGGVFRTLDEALADTERQLQ